MLKKLLVTALSFLVLTNTHPTLSALKIGHRGACGYEPDNTLRSFAKAIECGVDMVELDVHVCASGELVVFHDPKLPDGRYVANVNLREILTYDAGKGERIPTLEQVFELLLPTKIVINIELKGKGTDQPVASLIEKYMQKGYPADRFVATSFDHFAVLEFRTLCPAVSTGVILEGLPIGLAACAQDAQADYVVTKFEFINQAFVDHAHAHNIKVFVYTVNDYELIEAMKALGVDGIISNFPDRI
jgi:glycerophosphoryl diester phosphodiesterase